MCIFQRKGDLLEQWHLFLVIFFKIFQAFLEEEYNLIKVSKFVEQFMHIVPALVHVSGLEVLAQNCKDAGLLSHPFVNELLLVEKHKRG